MNFSDLRAKASEYNHSQGAISNLKDYEIKFLWHFHNQVTKLKEIAGKEFEYLYADLIERNGGIDFQPYLGKAAYISASNFAKACLELDMTHHNLTPNQAYHWIINALHCFDHLVVHYVNLSNLTIIPKGNWLKETHIYQVLIDKGGDSYEIGISFKSIYELRSDFHHIHQIEEKTGKLKIKDLSNAQKKKKLETVISLLKTALETFQAIYTTLTNAKK